MRGAIYGKLDNFMPTFGVAWLDDDEIYVSSIFDNRQCSLLKDFLEITEFVNLIVFIHKSQSLKYVVIIMTTFNSRLLIF